MGCAVVGGFDVFQEGDQIRITQKALDCVLCDCVLDVFGAIAIILAKHNTECTFLSDHMLLWTYLCTIATDSRQTLHIRQSFSERRF